MNDSGIFCAGSGEPETYSGKDMLITHKGMNISEQEFIRDEAFIKIPILLAFLSVLFAATLVT